MRVDLSKNGNFIGEVGSHQFDHLVPISRLRMKDLAVAVINIQPIEVSSVSGYPVVITGISPTEYDCIVGRITTPGAGLIDAVWSLNGIMRDGSDTCNLLMASDELAHLKNLALKLGVTPNP